MKKELDIKLTPEEVAEMFCSFGSDEQARFYNHVHSVANKWLHGQLQWITEDDGLTMEGRSVMSAIGDYSHWGLTCNDIKAAKP